MAARTLRFGIPLQRQVMLDCAADSSAARVPKRSHAVEFHHVAYFAVIRVITVLLAPARIPSYGLDVRVCEPG